MDNTIDNTEIITKNEMHNGLVKHTLIHFVYYKFNKQRPTLEEFLYRINEGLYDFIKDKKNINQNKIINEKDVINKYNSDFIISLRYLNYFTDINIINDIDNKCGSLVLSREIDNEYYEIHFIDLVKEFINLSSYTNKEYKKLVDIIIIKK